ncbi:MAG: hypothetical protein EBT86_09380 [Actinobacteria bacterium]|nr:hypothetical protein [Actinomycetota bacterium]
MNLRIYQVFYSDDHINNLDPAFTPLDNRANSHPELREFPVMLRMHDQAQQDKVEYYGLMSTRWKEKMPAIQGQALIDFIVNNPGYDIYVYDPVPWYDAYSYNVWEQGNFYHPYILPIANALLPHMNMDLKWLKMPITKETIFWCCYVVAHSNFWKEWFNFFTSYPTALIYSSPDIKNMHNQSAQYSGKKSSDSELSYFPFMHERLLTTFVQSNQYKYKIKSYRHYETKIPQELQDLSELKLQAVKNKDLQLIRKWIRDRQRFLYGPDMATQWVQEYFNE